MKIKIKHNIKRDGCTLSGQILYCQFLVGERGNFPPVNIGKFYLGSLFNPELSLKYFFVWGHVKANDLQKICYNYPSEKDAQAMLDFINTFVEKDEAVKEETKEKRYMIVEVGGRKCPQRIEQDYEGDIASFCKINALNPCLEENCPFGNTLKEAADIMLRFGLLGKVLTTQI